MEDRPHVIIVGAGALGSFIGGMLSTVTRVSLIGREPHLRVIRERGLDISGITEGVYHPVAAIEPSDIPRESGKVFIFTVKGYNTRLAVETVRQFVEQGDVAMTLQNGIGNDEIISEILGCDRLIAGVTSNGITFGGPGQITHAGTGETVIGAIHRRDHHLAQTLSDLFNAAGIGTRMTRNICGEIWTKLIVNAAINPLTAITGMRNGCLLEMRELMDIVAGIVEEVETTARAVNIRLPECDKFEKTVTVIRNTARNKSSMLQDIERSRRTEIDSINGAVVRYATSAGLDVPLNRLMTSLVRAIEPGDQ